MAWLLAGALSTLLFLNGPPPAARAETPTPPTTSATPEPAATPTSAVGASTAPAEKPTADASAKPGPSAAGSASAPAFRARPDVSTNGVVKPIRQLVADMRSGALTKTEAADLAIRMVEGSPDVPRRYRLHQVTEYDVMVLGIATGGPAVTDSDSSRHAPRSASNCVEVTINDETHHSCAFGDTHTFITYVHEKVPGASSDPVVVPTFVQRWADVSDAAWEYYADVDGLAMTPTSDHITVALQMDGLGNTCGSWPTAQIFCGPDITLAAVEYLAAHEMFHQFQWNYVNRAIPSFFALNPWMESTADWASAHFTTTNPRAEGSWTGEAARIHAFFSSTGEGLVSRDHPTGSTISGDRAYGAVAAVEFLTQATSEALVKESFDAINLFTIDGLTPINDALAEHETSLDDLSDYLWWAMYTMCDGTEPWSPFGWCSDLSFTVTPSDPGAPQTKRPDHGAVWLASDPGGTVTPSIRRYGAVFTDFVLGGLAENAYGTTLALEFDGDQVTAEDRVNLVAWKDTPGGEQCDTRQMVYPASEAGKTAIAVQIPTGCGYATLVAVNKHTGTGVDAVPFPVTWSTLATGALIGNGTVTLGVTAEGSLGLGPSGGMACRSGHSAARQASDYLEPGPALVLDATGFEAIRGFGRYCYSPEPTEGWSVISSNEPASSAPSTWSKQAFDYHDEYPAPVTAFTFTATEATSVVRLGAKFTLTQHWHPSGVDSRIYQLDVTVESTGPLAGGFPLTYRQVVPLNITGNIINHVDLFRGAGGGVTDATTNLYGTGGADYGPDTIDNPLVPLPPNDCEATDCRGLALDRAVHGLSTIAPASPQFSMYYGFADTPSEAASLLGSAGTTTGAIAEITDWDDNTFALLVGQRDRAS